MNKPDILRLRARAERELFVLFGLPLSEITEARIMYMVGLYMTDVDTLSLAFSMMNKDYESLYPSEPGNDIEETEEEKSKRRWEKYK